MANLKVSQDSTGRRWLRQILKEMKGDCDTATSVEMATQLSELRKNLEGFALKGKKMAAQSRRYKIVPIHFSLTGMATDEVVGILARAVHLWGHWSAHATVGHREKMQSALARPQPQPEMTVGSGCSPP